MSTVKNLIENCKSKELTLIRVGNTPRSGPLILVTVMVGLYVYLSTTTWDVIDEEVTGIDWTGWYWMFDWEYLASGLEGCWWNWGSGRKMVGLLFNKRRWFLCGFQCTLRRRKGFTSSCRREALSVIEFKVPIKLDITMMMMNAIKLESVIWIQFQAFKWLFNGMGHTPRQFNIEN